MSEFMGLQPKSGGRRIRQMLAQRAAVLLCICLILPYPAQAGNWAQEGSVWQYEKEDGTKAADGWLQDSTGSWYYFGSDAAMKAGWLYQDMAWYFLSTVPGHTYGAMLTGWQWIDGRCYFFGDDGAMYAGTVTPDGYQVDGTGAWVENGTVVEIPGKGIQTAVSKIPVAVGRGSGGNGGGGPSSPGRPDRPGKPDGEDVPPPKPDGEGKPDDGFPDDNNEEIPDDDRIPDGEKPDEEIPDEDGEVGTPSDATPSDATPSDADMVQWQVRFVDQETHQIQVSPGRQGKIEDGDNLTVNYRTKVIDEEGRIWEAVKEPPMVITVYGPGLQIYYIEYVLTGTVEEDKDPFEEERKLLSEWTGMAKEHEALLTGEEAGSIPDSRVIVSGRGECEERLLTAVGQIADTSEHIVYVIGKNTIPNGIILKDIYREGVEYSNLQEGVLTIGEDTYTLARFAITRSYNEDQCTHEWDVMTEGEATCLRKGSQTYGCMKCGLEEEIITAALGHIDMGGDSICDRCSTRAFAQEEGSTIKASIEIEGAGRRELTFTCIDGDYQDGMLYVSNEEIPLADFGGYGSLEYQLSNPAKYFERGWQNAFSITGNPLMRITADGTTGYAMLLSQEEVRIYRGTLAGEYLTRTADGDGLAAIREDGTAHTVPVESATGIRPAILLKNPDAGEPEKVYWRVGDVQAREIDGETYLFRCVDQNYADKTETHRQAALFLCDSVIPANFGSEYIFGTLPDGTHGYVFHPGPIVNFGTSNDYKRSKVRNWLKDNEGNFFNTEPVNIGVSYAYSGSTEEGMFEQLKESSLAPSYIGSQRMADKLFILSVDEALKYKNWLWRFDGSEAENPETQYGAFAKSYWLRSPMGTGRDHDTDLAYTVDLIHGNIRPAAIRPSGDSDDDEINVTGTIGVRPVFTMPQN